MADIQIIIGYETVTQADQAFKILDKTVKSTAKQYEQAFNKITGWQKKFSNEQNKVNASLNNQHLAQQKSNKSARESAKAFEDAARAVEKEATALHNLRMATDNVYRNQQKRLQMKKLLKAAVVAETMSTEQAIVALKKYNAAQTSSNKVMNMAKNRMNGNNMAIQQLGYQFGDFAVQVQGGTSAFVAFSQQGAQLAGILPMIAGPLGLTMGAAVGLSAALGILIPIGSAVGRMFFEMRGEAKEAAEKAETLTSKIKSLDQALKDFGDTKKAISLGLTPEEFTAKSQLELDVESLKEAEAALANMEAAIAIAQGLGSTLSTSVVKGAQKLGFLPNEEDVAEAKKTIIEAEQRIIDTQTMLRTKAREAAEGELLKSYAMTQREQSAGEEKAHRSKKDRIQRIRSLMGVIDAERIAREKKLDDAGDAVILQNQADAERALFDANTKYEADQKKLDAAGDIAILQAQADAERDLFKANAKYEADQKALDEKGDVAILENNARIENELFAANAKYEAEQAALRLKEQTELNQVVTEMATRLAIPFAQALNLIRQAKAEASVGLDAFGGGGDFKYEDTTTFTPEGFGKGPKNLGGGGKTDKEKLAEYLEGKQQELTLEKQLVGVFGAERDIKSELFEVEQEYGNLIDTTQDSQLAGTLRQIEAEKERHEALEEAQAQQQTMADTLQSSMSDAFMSMVDGTKSFKDAMKDMARSVIKQLYDILVVQRLVGSFDSKAGGSGLVGMIMGAFQANGGAWQGGSQIKAYADGGVVGGPTTFPMAGGKTGLMGEAGPEAIMPLKRGANGKLGVQMEGGGGQNVVINQSFNFQANGDDSVKKIIAQAAPQIAQMTKSSLLNDRRRGGATKAAFG